jgi:ParB/RepB/Spo0J family partition protein
MVGTQKNGANCEENTVGAGGKHPPHPPLEQKNQMANASNTDGEALRQQSDWLKEQPFDKESIVFLATQELYPNDYNPNRMDADGFEELLTEVRHLGRLPKPVIARQHEAGYQIVDGEHGWRAAREVGLKQVPCEIIAADDFEAMRQTYKRNQHGAHAPVALGRMFRRMMDSRGLSARALAKEIAVSEGTVRNALLYADASEVRNSYAFDRLSVREVRAYLDLPPAVRDIWLDAGADLHELWRAATFEIVQDGKKTKMEVGLETFQAMADQGLAWALNKTDFVESCRLAFQFLEWKNRYEDSIENLDAYFTPLARLRLPLRVLDEFLPARCTDDRIQILMSPEQWDAMLRDCDKRADGDAEKRDAMIAASIRLHLRRQGVDSEDLGNPRVALLLESGPDFIRQADLPLLDKVRLICHNPDVPADVLLEAKRGACEDLKTRQAVLAPDPETLRELELEQHTLQSVQAHWRSYTPEQFLQHRIADILRERTLAARDHLFGDPDRIRAAILKRLQEMFVFRESKMGGRPTSEVLGERLAALPWPEFVYLAAHVTGHEDAALSFWIRAVCAELGIEATSP